MEDTAATYRRAEEEDQPEEGEMLVGMVGWEGKILLEIQAYEGDKIGEGSEKRDCNVRNLLCGYSTRLLWVLERFER